MNTPSATAKTCSVQPVSQAGTDLVVGFLDLLLCCCARYPKNLVKVLFAAGRGTCVKGLSVDSVWWFEAWNCSAR